MVTASDGLRAQLLSVVSQLGTVDAGDGAAAATRVKQELQQVLSVIAVLQTDVRDSLEHAVALLDPSNPTLHTSALALVARAAAFLSSSPAASSASDASAPLPRTPAAPSTPTRSFPLPIELITHILDFVHPLTEYKERQRSNMSMALVSRAFYRAASVFLNSELHITDANQFLGLKALLNEDGEVLSAVRTLTLHFNFSALHLSRDDDLYGRTWLAPTAKRVLLNMDFVEELAFGGIALKSVERNEFLEGMTYTHFRQLGVVLDHMPVKHIRLYVPLHGHVPNPVGALLWDSAWSHFERITVLSYGATIPENMRMDGGDTGGSWPL